VGELPSAQELPQHLFRGEIGGCLRIEPTAELEAPADAVWNALRKSETLRYVARPLLCFEGDLPRRWPVRGGVVRVERMLLLCVVPAWGHELRFVRVDDEGYEMLTNEGRGTEKGVEPPHQGRTALREALPLHRRGGGARRGTDAAGVVLRPAVLPPPADALARAGPHLGLDAPTFRERLPGTQLHEAPKSA
jgi:hypothetical protein